MSSEARALSMSLMLSESRSFGGRSMIRNWLWITLNSSHLRFRLIWMQSYIWMNWMIDCRLWSEF
jgi:hypothetical protein